MIGRHLRVWGQCFVQAVRRDLQFRTQALATAVTAVADVGLSLIPVLVVVSSVQDGGGSSAWTGPLATAVVGAYGVGTGLIDCFVAPNLQRIDRYVRRGELDLVLIRPLSAPLYTALRWMQPAELTRLVTGGGLLGYGLWAAHVTPSPMSIVLAAAWLVLGMAGYSLFWANLAYLAFWMDSAEPVNEIALQLRSAGQYPLAYYPDVARSALCTVVPASLIGALPVTVLAGTSTASALIWAFVAISIVATATYAHWVLALRRYGSASS